jgi:hypothetical protein
MTTKSTLTLNLTMDELFTLHQALIYALDVAKKAEGADSNRVAEIRRARRKVAEKLGIV